MIKTLRKDDDERIQFMNDFLKLNLQLFGEGGGDGGEGSADSTQEASESLDGVIYGKEDVAADATDEQTAAEKAPDKRAEFDALTKGEYKKEFNDRVETLIKARLADERKSATKKQEPLNQLLCMKYGVDPKSDNLSKALLEAIENDNSIWEQEAMERGLTVEQFKHVRALEQQNAEFQRMAEQQQNEEKINAMVQDAEELKQIYPEFDLDVEMNNPDFVDLIAANIPVRTAFEVIHKDEIMEGAMRYTANIIQQKTVNDIRARGTRPKENGMSATASATYKRSVADLSDADIDEVASRVLRGERISF